MSNPQENEKPEEQAAEEQASQELTPAGGGGFVFRAVIVAAITFVVVIAMAIALSVFVFPEQPKLDMGSDDEGDSQAAEDEDGPSEVKDLIKDGEFTTVLGPDGRRSVTYRYDICVKVKASGAKLLEEFISKDGKNMMPKISERVRQIIGEEDYEKLRVESLDGVKRRIRDELNDMLGKDVVEEVIFESWNVFL